MVEWSREEENPRKDVKIHRMTVPERKVTLYHTSSGMASEKIGADDKAWKVMTTMKKVYNNSSYS